MFLDRVVCTKFLMWLSNRALKDPSSTVRRCRIFIDTYSFADTCILLATSSKGTEFHCDYARSVGQ